MMQFLVSGRFNAGFSFGLMRKDFPAATDLAKRLSATMPLGDVPLKSWTDAETTLGVASDHRGIFRLLDGQFG